ncbi:MAG: regulatory protein RecX [Bacteroidota bacterium]
MANLYNRKKEEKINKDTAKVKIARYCAYQERAHKEVEEKLKSYGLNYSEVEDLLAWLITENYVNEERYAVTVAGGKFRAKKWGKLKIQQLLKQKDISEYSINKALDQIEEEEYLHTLEQLVRNKWEKTTAPNVYELRNKVAKFVIGKGFEPELTWTLIKDLIKG